MADPFSPCGQHNRDDIPCGLCRGHLGACEVSPFHRKLTSQPVWSPDLPPFRDAMTVWREELGYDPITGGEL